MRRLALVSLTLIAFVCNLSCRQSTQSVVGSWEIVNMSRAAVPVDKLPAAKLASGRWEFRADGTFEATVVAPGAPQGRKVAGMYTVEGDTITITNDTTKTPTRSKVRFERDHLVLEPITSEPFSFTMYYKRIK